MSYGEIQPRAFYLVRTFWQYRLHTFESLSQLLFSWDNACSMDYWTTGLWLFRRWAPHFSNNIHLDAHLGWLKWSLTGMYINALYPVCNHRNISENLPKVRLIFCWLGLYSSCNYISLHSPFFWPRIKSYVQIMSETSHDWEWLIAPIKMVMTSVFMALWFTQMIDIQWYSMIYS